MVHGMDDWWVDESVVCSVGRWGLLMAGLWAACWAHGWDDCLVDELVDVMVVMSVNGSVASLAVLLVR